VSARWLLCILVCSLCISGSAEPTEGGSDAMVLIPRGAITGLLQKNRDLVDAAQDADDELERLQKAIDLLKIKQGCA
jgi:hypothetical protein